MDIWKNKIAVVTGASRGVGAEIAKTLVKEGMIVVGIARQVNLIEKMAVDWKAYAGKLYAYQMDLTVEDEIKTGFKWINKNIGPASILVNNAVFAEKSNLIDGHVDAWKGSMDTNIIGTTLCTREAVKIMTDNNLDGHIIFIGDIGAHNFHLLNGCVNVYVPTKCALKNLLEYWRQELNEAGSKIKTSMISPGFVKTTGLGIVSPSFAELYRNKPHLSPGDIADCLVYMITRTSHCLIHQIIIKPFGEKEL